jgi:hypothetical protein
MVASIELDSYNQENAFYIVLILSSSSSNVRIPRELYETLRQIRLSLESQYQAGSPTIQDMVNVAIKRFIQNLENPEIRAELLTEMMEQRSLSRKKMGRNKGD